MDTASPTAPSPKMATVEPRSTSATFQAAPSPAARSKMDVYLGGGRVSQRHRSMRLTGMALGVGWGFLLTGGDTAAEQAGSIGRA